MAESGSGGQGQGEKLQYFQDVTGVDDPLLAEQILDAHQWDLGAAVGTLMDKAGDGGPRADTGRGTSSDWDLPDETTGLLERGLVPTSVNPAHHGPSEVFGSQASRSNYDRYQGSPPSFEGPGEYHGGVVNFGLGALGLNGSERRGDQGSSVPSGTAEAEAFLRKFEQEYGVVHPNFQRTSFMDALRLAGQQFKFLFVYLHSPEHANTPLFCERTLCSEPVVQFVNENFVAWGGDVRESEGFQMSNSLKASTYPFCAVVMGSNNQRIALLQQVEGPRTAEELMSTLQRVVEEQGSVLVASRVEEEERQLNRRLREEQDAAYQAALQADQERERLRREEAARQAREEAEAEQRKREEEEAARRAVQEAAEREAALEQRRLEKAMALGVEPEKGPDVTQVLVRMPNGERRERRFQNCTKVSAIYDYVDSLGTLEAVKYNLVTNFPRVVYGPEKRGQTLKDAGLHPHASLFVLVEDN
ncbi:plant UBX domain-containing protein 10 isoform X3 [Physcomitrium patens]|uniref:plant UBX domain-containing protein 10 isoform X3 n=1 Tax=Physcomitrium patens TaxID=3218 RepID=UPI003CCC8FAD